MEIHNRHIRREVDNQLHCLFAAGGLSDYFNPATRKGPSQRCSHQGFVIN